MILILKNTTDVKLAQKTSEETSKKKSLKRKKGRTNETQRKKTKFFCCFFLENADKKLIGEEKVSIFFPQPKKKMDKKLKVNKAAYIFNHHQH